MNNKIKDKKDGLICWCNEVPRSTIEDAIKNRGAKTLNEIFDLTGAGVGACGGTCRRQLAPLLEGFLQDGQFPDTLPPRTKTKT